VAIGHSYGCTGDHDINGGHVSYATNPPQPARIKQGTQLFADKNVGPWATVLVEDGYKILHAPGETWAQVTTIPGVTFEPGATAYVPLSALIVDASTTK
jgi:hypothetical protein